MHSAPTESVARRGVAVIMLALLVMIGDRGARAADEESAVTLARDGKALLPILTGSVADPASELREYLQRISGASFTTEPAKRGKAGVYVGLADDFPWVDLPDTRDLGSEGFVIRSDGGSVYLVAQRPRGVQHAVATFLYGLGCRWFFAGEAWEVVPRRGTIAGKWNERHTPDFPTQRRIWYGFGAYPSGRRDLEAWERHNRMGSPIEISIGHTWHGLNAEREFDEHPQWFALVEGKRQPSKPCYSHPAVIERAIESALRQAAQGREMISMTPPDGLGYCECERCLAVLEGGEPMREHGTLFARRRDGLLVNVTSETLFAMVNKVAAAVAERHPDTLIGCYAYSAYSHPPSFDLHPNVYLQTTTAFRRTPMTLEEQLGAFGEKTRQLGIREYYSVYQWDWDYPDPGKMTPKQLQRDLQFFRESGVTAINAEASNNWGPRGLGYYVAAHLMWEVDADVKALVRDFYETAFGPAAPAVQRYYVRWYGAEAAVLDDPRGLPEKRVLFDKGRFDAEALRAAMADLDEADRLVRDEPAYRRRLDLLRMYVHYLVLRYALHEAEQSGDARRIVEAIRDETVFGGRLTDTHMIHSRPLIGKAFARRFRKHEALLADIGEAQDSGKSWRRVGEPPDREELDRLWARDKALLGIE